MSGPLIILPAGANGADGTESPSFANFFELKIADISADLARSESETAEDITMFDQRADEAVRDISDVIAELGLNE